ncbi:MAG: hypothetical protein ACQESR_30515, partial [Planctomycetota bacterium]
MTFRLHVAPMPRPMFGAAKDGLELLEVHVANRFTDWEFRSRSRVPLHGLDTQGPHGCHGLVPWWFTLAATN